MNKNIYVITNPELGWDCVCGVYEADSEEDVAINFIEEELEEGQTPLGWMEEHSYVIHDKYLIKI